MRRGSTLNRLCWDLTKLTACRRVLELILIGEVGREPVIDREPGQAGVRQRFEEWSDIRHLVTRLPTATVHDDDGRYWFRGLGDRRIKPEPVGRAIENVLQNAHRVRGRYSAACAL